MHACERMWHFGCGSSWILVFDHAVCVCLGVQHVPGDAGGLHPGPQG